MTTKQDAIEAKKLIDEFAEIQSRPMLYAQADEYEWKQKNLERLQQLMTYVVDDLINEPYISIKEVAKAS